MSEVELGVQDYRNTVVEEGRSGGPYLQWRKVNFTVTKQGNTRHILQDVAGEVPPEQVCAIMGPSGAGKSSLLNVLAGRSSSKPPSVKVSAKMEIDGEATNPVEYHKKVAYVMQDDNLMPTATPREAIRFSATLRLGPEVSADELEARVQNMLEDLELTKCADVLIGGEMIKGISGGQRKRTSVGVELVTRPRLIFLDEPTSGLDSESAMNCIKLVQRVARRGATVLCTIHQPSSEVFALFDRLVFMKDGLTMYQGPMDQLVPVLERAGYPVPMHHNASDHIMSVAQRYDNKTLEDAGLFNQLTFYAGHQTPATGEHHEHDTGERLLPEASASFLTQVHQLVKREIQGNLRDTAALGGRFGVTIFLNILFGLIFQNSAGRDDANMENLNSHFGALVMATIGSMFGTAQPVMLSFPLERPIFLREYATGTYSATAYFISKGCVEIPLAFAQAVVQYLCIYFLYDMQGNFIHLATIAWALGIASSSVAVVLGCSVPDVRAVAELAPAVFVPQMLFAGFFVRISQIPQWLRWAQYLCALKYALNLLSLAEFDDCGANSDNPSVARANCKELLDSNDIDRSDTTGYWIFLAALFVGFRLLGSFVLVKKAEAL